MSLPTIIETKLHKFVNPKILFIEEVNQFIFNEKWTIDINEKTLKDSLGDILNDVNEHLKVGLQNKEFLKSLIEVLDKKIEWFSEDKILEINHFNDFVPTIKKSHLAIDKEPPAKEKYTIEDILKCDENSGWKLSDIDNYYFDLWYFREEFNNYNDSIDFEKVKLFYVMKLFYTSLITAYQYLENLVLNHDSLDFSEFDYEKLLIEFEIRDGSSDNFRKKCHVTLNKKETAHLFAVLIQTGLFYFHSNERKNRAEMTKFIEAHFTCNGDNNSINTIKNLNQEFTPVFYPNEKELLPFLVELIGKLQVKKSQLE